MLIKIRELIDRLNDSAIKYCHWKSNAALAESLAGETDIDLLVRRQDASRFRSILGQLSFRPALTTDGKSFPSVEHYFALDDETGVLVHVHAYYRVITGESLAKNYRFPIEEILLDNTREEDSVPVPTKSAELVVFTLRMMLKHTSVIELLLISRYWKQVKGEVKWLLESASIDESIGFVDTWLPSLDTRLFSECVAALDKPANLFRRILLGLRLRSQLRPYARHSVLCAWWMTVQKFSIKYYRRLTKSQKGMVLGTGGAMIAFVGSEAAGKSTLLANTNTWLDKYFSVRQIHAGKPKSTFFSFVPNLFVPALRCLFPTRRSGYIESQYDNKEKAEKPPSSYPLTYALRSILLAYDRRSLLKRAFGRAANGTVVLCDRYPSATHGAPDSPQLAHLPISAGRYSVHRRLAQIESRLYRQIPPPDLVIHLSAPLELTVSRNATRGKKEPEDYVRRRHAKSSNLKFEKAPFCEINTDQPLDQTILEVKKAIWNAL